MSNKPDGGPAFPVGEEALIRNLQGATLRDYFAAKAMQGLMGRNWYGAGSDDEIIATWARSAYAVADAMLKARES